MLARRGRWQIPSRNRGSEASLIGDTAASSPLIYIEIGDLTGGQYYQCLAINLDLGDALTTVRIHYMLF